MVKLEPFSSTCRSSSNIIHCKPTRTSLLLPSSGTVAGTAKSRVFPSTARLKQASSLSRRAPLRSVTVAFPRVTNLRVFVWLFYCYDLQVLILIVYFVVVVCAVNAHRFFATRPLQVRANGGLTPWYTWRFTLLTASSIDLFCPMRVCTWDGAVRFEILPIRLHCTFARGTAGAVG